MGLSDPDKDIPPGAGLPPRGLVAPGHPEVAACRAHVSAGPAGPVSVAPGMRRSREPRDSGPVGAGRSALARKTKPSSLGPE